jgi:signal transduction histidine kinase/DNA-binding response OmpR family regulator
MSALFKRFALIYAPVVILISIALVLICRFENQRRIRDIEAYETRHIQIAKANISIDFQGIDSDLRIISNLPLLHKYLDSGDENQRAELAEFFLVLSRTKRHYDKIRYLDSTGKELIRVNFNDGTPGIVPEGMLQNKSSRYFFQDTFRLKRGEVYVSPFDLNSEDGRLELPYKPTIRFGTPVFDSNGEKKGILIFNYLGNYLLSDFHQEMQEGNLDGILLNRDGYWLSSSNPTDEWGFMLNRHDRNFGNDFADEWRIISTTTEGALQTQKGLFIYGTAFPLLFEHHSSTGSASLDGESSDELLPNAYYWKIVSFIPQAELSNTAFYNRKGNRLLIAAIYISMALVSFIIASITLKRKRAEEELRQIRRNSKAVIVAKNQELMDSCQELEVQRQIAENASQAKSEFLTNMSHEIRTPMNGVLGMLDILRNSEMSAEQKDLLETAANSAEALLAIINDILDFSRLEAGKIDLEIIKFNLVSLVEEVCSLQAGLAHAKSLELTCLLPVDFPTYWEGDPTRIRQVLTNLVGNAVKFTRHGEISVRVIAPDSGHLRFEVKDTGLGISPETKARLFQAFTQADSSTARRFGGTGLGLSISKTLVELMDGEIGVDSEIGLGATFWFNLPLVPFGQELSSELVTDLTHKRVLVVDDNATNRAILEYYLNNWGCKVISIDSAEAAIQVLQEAVKRGEKFDILLLDQQMPEMDGLTLMRTINQLPDIATTPCLLLSSGGFESEAECKALGITQCLLKPVRQSQLFDAIIHAIETAKPQSVVIASPVSSPETRVLPDYSSKRVLIVEDNQVNQKVVMAMLSRFNLKPDLAENGEEALAQLARQTYDLVLMDCQMPVMDGYAATRILREREAAATSARQPIIALTAHATQEAQATCLAAGMDDYLSKPINRHELSTLLARWLG